MLSKSVVLEMLCGQGCPWSPKGLALSLVLCLSSLHSEVPSLFRFYTSSSHRGQCLSSQSPFFPLSLFCPVLYVMTGPLSCDYLSAWFPFSGGIFGLWGKASICCLLCLAHNKYLVGSWVCANWWCGDPAPHIRFLGGQTFITDSDYHLSMHMLGLHSLFQVCVLWTE